MKRAGSGVFAAIVLATGLIAVNPIPAQAVTNTQTFTSNGTFTVPAGVTALNVTVTGAAGGLNTDNVQTPGSGAVVRADLTAVPGRTLTIMVGGIGGSSSTATGGTGGAPGGGSGGGGGVTYFGGGGGGGYSGIFAGAANQGNALVVAGGGGGAAWGHAGGNAGNADGSGSPGAGALSSSNGGGGGGGTTTAGGSGGARATDYNTPEASDGVTGSALSGGTGGSTTNGASAGGGAGGGGYFGGGGGGPDDNGVPGAGGGGSSYLRPSAGTGTISTATTVAAGSVVISFATKYPQSQRRISHRLHVGNNVVNLAGATTEQGLPMSARVSRAWLARSLTRGDLRCFTVHRGPHRKLSVWVTGACRNLRISVTYWAPGNETYLAYRHSITFRAR